MSLPKEDNGDDTKDTETETDATSNEEGEVVVPSESEDAKSLDTAATPSTVPTLGAPANDPTDSKLLSAQGFLTSEVGTPYYTAPEVVCAKHYDFKCDVYSMGAILYSCLTGGKLPIKGKDERETIKLLMYPKKPIDFSDKVWLGYKEGANEEKKDNTEHDDDQISQSARDFCKLLLERDPTKRPTAYEAMQHEWLASRFGAPPPLPEPMPDDLVDGTATDLSKLSCTTEATTTEQATTEQS